MTDRKFNVKDYVYLKVDVFVKKPGVGDVLYAPAGSLVRVMAYDPNIDLMYGIRPESERYRNAQVSEDMLLTETEFLKHAQSVGL